MPLQFWSTPSAHSSIAAGFTPGAASSQSPPRWTEPAGAVQASVEAPAPKPSPSESAYQGDGSVGESSAVPSQSWSISSQTSTALGFTLASVSSQSPPLSTSPAGAMQSLAGA